MSPANAKLLVFVSGGLLVGLALLSGKGDTYKRVWAASLWTTGLAVAADISPEIVGPFAVLILIAASLQSKGSIGKFFGGDTAPVAAASKPTAAGRPAGAPVGS